MATNLFRIYRASADVAQCRAAPAPSGGVYVAEGDLLGGANGNVSGLLRLSSSGSVVWSKAVTLTGASIAVPYLTSNATHLAVGHEHDSGTGVTLYAADGTEVWSVLLPVYHWCSTGDPPYSAPPMALGADNSVFVIGAVDNGGFYEDAVLTKLAAADGAAEWSVNLRDSGSAAGGSWPGPMSVLTGGDVVVHVRGVLNYVLRLDGTDGSVVWSKGVVWPSGNPETGIGTDGDDNVYLCGRPHTSTTKVLPVAKLDSSGATLWNRNVAHGSGLGSLAFNLEWQGAGRLTCDDTGVYIAGYVGGSLGRYGHVFVPADGTIAAGTALVAAFTPLTASLSAAAAAASGATDLHNTLCFLDFTPTTETYAEAIAVIAGSADSEDGSWGGHDRDTYAFDVGSGTAVISTQTYTRASMPSFSASTFSKSVTTSDLLVESFVEIYNASAIEPTTTFGTPRQAGYVIADEYTPTTAFGTPRLLNTVTATAVESGVTFGTAALEPDRTVGATAIEPTAAFGLPESTRTTGPQPRVADGFGPTAVFGRPIAAAATVCTASGASTTAFGTPVLGLVALPEGFETTAFGDPTIKCVARPNGFRSTVFGTPVRAQSGIAVGFARTRFGTPRVAALVAPEADGFSTTTFGTPSCLNSAQRARSGVFRTQWGRAQAERTAP